MMPPRWVDPYRKMKTQEDTSRHMREAMKSLSYPIVATDCCPECGCGVSIVEGALFARCPWCRTTFKPSTAPVR